MREVTALAPWFGANRMLASEVGKLLDGCRWVGVPFAGGMSELEHIDAPTIVVGDLHKQVINLAQVVSHPVHGPELYRRLRRAAFHPDTLSDSQLTMKTRSEIMQPVSRAYHYFICCWMGRSAKAGTDGEFSGSLPVRWTSSGGDSNTRFRSATSALLKWRKIMRRCNFVCMDYADLIGNVKDQAGHAIYLDPPWPDDGDKYKHKFSEADQRKCAEIVSRFENARVVVRYGDHPLIRELYPEPRWTWTEQTSRTQANTAKREVLITSNCQAILDSCPAQ
jgi:DNA adenine methylase